MDLRERAEPSQVVQGGTNTPKGYRPSSAETLSGRHPTKWDKTGTVVEVLQYHQYPVRTDGSGHLMTRNRRFLRRYDPHLMETAPTLPPGYHLPTSQVNPPDAGTAQTEHPTTSVPPTTRPAPIAIPGTRLPPHRDQDTADDPGADQDALGHPNRHRTAAKHPSCATPTDLHHIKILRFRCADTGQTTPCTTENDTQQQPVLHHATRARPTVPIQASTQQTRPVRYGQ